ncbi:IclR family transcriptional regulator [Pseudooceanicola sp.]|uniref:IclR family transcriptional regulator n=1 Tax=Pseudooceanicola sp. TaxID=1914328 RepID=UPI000C095459|nr:IclR family transcriptional regulator [Pseudooceanicola sp.]|tara:strand:+ start:1290 stop:2006 length:717 start_codon:yes stop_codon:yes gene_type:complete
MSIRSVVRAFAVFDCFSEDSKNLTLHQISQKLDLPKSTVFRLLNTLVEIGYIHYLDDQTYCMSLKVLRLGNLVPSTLGIRDVARPELRALAEMSGETVSLSLLDGNDRMVLDVMESTSKLRSIVRVGEVVKLHKGAVGRVLMAFQPKLNIAEVFGDAAVPEELDRELEEIRAAGYAFSVGHRLEGAAGIAAPVFDMNGECNYCISVAGPEVRMLNKKDEIASHLTACAQRLSRHLGNS